MGYVLLEDPIYTFNEFKDNLKYYRYEDENCIEIRFEGHYKMNGILDKFMMQYRVSTYTWDLSKNKEDVREYERKNLYHKYLQKLAWER